MNKVLMIFSRTNFPEGAFEFAKKLNEVQPILLSAVFIPQISYMGLWTPEPAVATEFIELAEEEIKLAKENIERLKNLCRENKIQFKIKGGLVNFTFSELRHETRFNDLFIVSSEKFYSNILEDNPDEYLREVLHVSECPVIIVPDSFRIPPTKNIFSYDAGESSVFAIKQFIYLFPEFCRRRSSFVYVKDDDDPYIPYEEDMRELAETHIPEFTFMRLGKQAKFKFTELVSENTDSIVVGSSYGRPKLSQLFSRDYMNEVISRHLLPVFIANK
jgi:nucleotide-binding universal stress UspA family protein